MADSTGTRPRLGDDVDDTAFEVLERLHELTPGGRRVIKMLVCEMLGRPGVRAFLIRRVAREIACEMPESVAGNMPALLALVDLYDLAAGE